MSPNYLYGDITSKILEAYFYVFRELRGRRWLEERSITRALVEILRTEPFEVAERVPVKIKFHDVDIGEGLIDVLVERKIVLEIKTITRLRRKDFDQIRTYLHEGGYAVGLLLNFGSPAPEYKRVENRDAFPIWWKGT